ncbi:MAG TPA: A/G-specific adenine glycosylase [Fredinandcohnia sp.]|nr:A/G-specific adenine glycosylase [Fredinandcohnia sp.]
MESSPSIPPRALRALHKDVLAWYRRSARDLPWRRTRDPYRIWVSEIMLQQTRVEVVRPYWQRFLERFPTVEALANAPEDEVLAAWSGLGYYGRARSLHRAAKAVVERHGGTLPADAAALAQLPGFGPYTVAAVGSIAFGLPLAAVDGNIARVLARWLCLEGDPRAGAQRARLQRAAEAFLPPELAGDWNQALMELGATICGRNPACLACPAQAHCLARRRGRQGEIPPPRSARQRPVLRLAAALYRRGDAVLLAKRPPEGLFASLWELPAVELGEGEAPAARLAEWLGGAEVGEEVGSVEQILTHRELRVQVFAIGGAHPPRVGAPYVEARLVEPGGLPGGLSSAARKALRAAGVRV